MAVDNDKNNKHTLHIKKHAKPELHYYYSREERLAQPAASKLQPQKTKEKKIRRSSLIILLDIILIVVAFILFRIFFFGAVSKTTLMGFSFELKQIVTEESIIASITVKKLETSEEINQNQAHITFSLPDSNKSRYITVQLPNSMEKENITRANFPYNENDKTLKAHITIGNLSDELSIPIKK